MTECSSKQMLQSARALSVVADLGLRRSRAPSAAALSASAAALSVGSGPEWAAKSKAGGGQVKFVMAMVALGAAILGIGGFTQYRQIQMTASTPGTVIEVAERVQQQEDRPDELQYGAVVGYSVNEKEYSSGPHVWSSSNRWSVGQRVEVRYDPGHPGRSSVVGGGGRVLPVFLMAFGGVWMAIFGLIGWKSRGPKVAEVEVEVDVAPTPETTASPIP